MNQENAPAVGRNARFGKCRACEEWVLRDEMLAIHVDIYDRDNKKQLVKLRFCETCWEEEKKELEEMEWDNVLHTHDELVSLGLVS